MRAYRRRPGVRVRLEADGGFSAWDFTISRYRHFRPEVLDLLRCFEGDRMSTPDEAIDKLDGWYELDASARERLAAQIPALVDCALLTTARTDQPFASWVERELERQPVEPPWDPPPLFVVGTPRSGTTLLTLLLHAHPRFHATLESHLVEVLVRALRSQSAAIEGSFLMHARYSGLDADAIARQMGRFAHSYFNELARRAGRARWVEKSCYIHEHLELVDMMFDAQARYLVAIRHPLDVAESIARGGAAVDTGVAEVGTRLERAVAFWCRQTDALISFTKLAQERISLVTYEDLVTEPEATLRRVLSFVGEAWEDDLLQRFETTEPPVFIRGDERLHQSRGAISSEGIARFRRWPVPLQERLLERVEPTLQALSTIGVQLAAPAE